MPLGLPLISFTAHPPPLNSAHTITEMELHIVEERVQDLMISDNLLNFCFLFYKIGLIPSLPHEAIGIK